MYLRINTTKIILIQWYNTFLSLGEKHYQDLADRRRVRIYNFICLASIIFVYPPVLTITIIQGNSNETLSVLVVILSTAIALWLNWNGNNQMAVIGGAVVVILSTYYVTFSAPAQTGAPYGNLILALSSIFLIKKRRIKVLIIIIAISSFLTTNYYQIRNLPFSETEYIAVLFLLFILCIIIMYYDHQMIGYQQKIKTQSEGLLKLESEKHQKEIQLKQKDLEMMLASASVRDQLTENLTSRLKEISGAEDIKKGIQQVIREMNAQSELINKQALIHQNVEELNAEFYERLLANFPDLTKSERELSAYLKLSLSNKEIAAIKNTTENSVNVSKARLRKKLGIESNRELARFLARY